MLTSTGLTGVHETHKTVYDLVLKMIVKKYYFHCSRPYLTQMVDSQMDIADARHLLYISVMDHHIISIFMGEINEHGG